jgi:hypothetical protein
MNTRKEQQRRSPFTFEEAKREYQNRIRYQSGDYEGVPLQNNTRLVKREEGGAYAVRLHNTDVVTYRPESVELRMEGWDTKTTRDRLDTYAPVRVRRGDGVTYAIPTDGDKVPVVDGIRFDYSGALLSDRPGGEVIASKERADELCRAYVRAYTSHIVDTSIKAPSAGDCWFCAMRTKTNGDGSIELTVPLGDALNDVAHLVSHIGENYFVPSLLLNAALEYYASQVHGDEGPERARHLVAVAVNGDRRHRELYEHTFRSVLRRYFQRRRTAIARHLEDTDALEPA